MVIYSWFVKQFQGSALETLEEIKQYTKGFLMFILSTTFRESFTFFRHYFDIVTAHEIMWQPWAMMAAGTVGLPDLIIPMPLLESIRLVDSLSIDAVTQFMVGLDANYFRAEGDYATFIQTHLMPPLIGTRGGERTRALTAREVRRATRAHTRRSPSAEQSNCWPVFPTTLTCWRHTRMGNQIPIKLAEAGHELVEASIEYTGSALELIASLMGMVQRREMLLSLHNPRYTDFTGDSNTSTNTGTSRHSESSESGDDGACSRSESGGVVEEGSGVKRGDDADSGSKNDSNSGADGHNSLQSSPLMKRTKRASRA
ncbi:hypothetical protein CsSME_00031100 [Camellia sinensis var. sinensis]